MGEIYKPERRFAVSLKRFDLCGYKNVNVALVKTDIENNADTFDFTKAIKDYDPGDKMNRDAVASIKELFTWGELEALRAYMKQYDGIQTFHYKEVQFPVSNKSVCMQFYHEWGNWPRYDFYRQKNYSLKLKVSAYIAIEPEPFIITVGLKEK